MLDAHHLVVGWVGRRVAILVWCCIGLRAAWWSSFGLGDTCQISCATLLCNAGVVDLWFVQRGLQRNVSWSVASNASLALLVVGQVASRFVANALDILRLVVVI